MGWNVKLMRAGQEVWVVPPMPSLMDGLTTTCHDAVEDHVHGVRVAKDTIPLVWLDERIRRPVTVAYAGLEPRLVETLREAGCEVQLTGNRPSALPNPQCPKSGGQKRDEALLKFVRCHERGLLRFDPARVHVDRLITEIAEAFPRKRILVVASRRNDVRCLYRRLKSRGLTVGRYLEGWASEGQFRVVVSTYGGLGTGLADAANRDIALYVNPAEVIASVGRNSLGALGRARVFGFMPLGLQLPPFLRDFVRMVFGDASISVPEHGRISRPVHVVFVASCIQGNVVRREDDLRVRRRLLWHHSVRNRRIARLAEALATEDCDRLGRMLPEATGLVSKRLGGRLGIVVESVEHGLELRRHLRGWPMLTGNEVTVEGMSPSDQARLIPVRKNGRLLGTDVIVTPSAIPEAGRFDILIRADAGVGLPALGGTCQLGDHGSDDPLLVIDFDDRHHPLVRKWTRSRKAAYQAAGWSVSGGPKVDAEDYLQTPSRDRQPILPYQSPREHRFEKGEVRTAEYHYGKRRERRQEKLLREGNGQITFNQVADRDHLVNCFRKLVREGGAAAGIDGISPPGVSLSEFGSIAEKLSKALREKRWRPQKPRLVPIPKPGTSETRDLKIGTLLDRVVGKALHETLQPHWEKIYLPGSFGFRKVRNVWQMIAELEATMEKNDCWMLAIDDVRKAFDNVSVKEALAAHQTIIMNKSKGKQPVLTEDVLELIETVLRGHDIHEMGIDQGGCYSPDALNIFLHAVHDAPLSAGDNAPLWFRYADNLVYPVQSVSEGRRVLARVRRLLRKVGLSLKGKDGIADLNAGDNALLLGFRLWREDGRLRIGLGENALDQLREHLANAWVTPDPNTTADAILRLWIGANGPAFKNGVTVIADVLRLASRLGFRELPGPAELGECWERAWQRWRACRKKVRHRVLRRKRR